MGCACVSEAAVRRTPNPGGGKGDAGRLVYVPQAVSFLPLLDSDSNRRWCSRLLLVTCALNLLYLLTLLLASRLVYSTIDRRRNAAAMLPTSACGCGCCSWWCWWTPR